MRRQLALCVLVAIARGNGGRNAEPDTVGFKVEQLGVFNFNDGCFAWQQIAQVGGVKAAARAFHHDGGVAVVDGFFVLLDGLFFFYDGAVESFAVEFNRKV